MSREEIELFLDRVAGEKSESVFLADGFDDAFLGLDFSDGDNPFAVYSIEKCIDILAKDMPEGEAWEYFDYNVLSANIGAGTPKFIHTI
jgi:hypothetical protein